MKKLLTILLSVLSMTVVAQKPKVAIYMTGDDALNEIVGNRLWENLFNEKKYSLVERSASFLSALGQEQSYQRTGEVDDQQISKLGKQFGIQYICVVSVLDVWGNEKYITSRIIDVNSAEVIGSCSTNGSISGSGSLTKALDDLSQKFVKVLNYSKDSKTKKVAVYMVKTGNRDVDIILGDQLVEGFSKSGDYVAVERTNAFLKQLKKESGYQMTGAVDDKDLMRLGKQFGVEYVCVAKSTVYGGAYYITTRLIDITTAEVSIIYNAEDKRMNNSNDVINVAREIAEKLTDVYLLSGERTGILYLNDGKYIGEIENGKPHGKGIIYYSVLEANKEVSEEDKEQYQGEWKNGLPHGQGILYYMNGSRYEGTWKDGKKNGQGTYYWMDGELYEGSWENDFINGYGTYYYRNCSKYEGHWKDNRYHGQGTYYWSDENCNEWSYEWSYGINYWKYGDRYEGNYKEGKKQGQGTYYWSNGERYEGNWENDFINGYGTNYYADGRKYKGYWKDDKRHGQGTMFYANGDRYEGIWYEDIENGNFTIYRAGGDKEMGSYVNGKLDGVWIRISAKGEMKTAQYSNGNLVIDWHK